MCILLMLDYVGKYKQIGTSLARLKREERDDKW
jgi:hypothetical protein